MPVDLSAAGLPSQYPALKSRPIPWLIAWAFCCAIGAGSVLLLWPTGTPTAGPFFWFCVLGLPNLFFCGMFGVVRSLYGALGARAAWRDRQRADWLAKRVRFAQQPLNVLGTGYCLPFTSPLLAEALAAGTPFITPQLSRGGSGLIEHHRFADNDPRLGVAPANEPASIDGMHDESDARVPATEPPSPVACIIEHALASVAPILHALCNTRPERWPAVRVVSAPEVADALVQQACTAMQRVGLPAVECLPASASDRLMLVDAWLDAGERRALLVIAVEWHDQPFERSTEAAAVVLLAPLSLKLPESVALRGQLHRPVDDPIEAMSDVLTNAVIWGQSEAPAVAQAWISGCSDHSALLAAFEQACLTGIAPPDAQRRMDPVIGDAGVARSWLSLAAAIESGAAGPQLLIDTGRTVQAALLHVNQTDSHDAIDE